MTEGRRQGRASEVAAQRRRRGDETLSAAKRLPIPQEIQAWANQEGMQLRWANDDGNRIHQLTKLDDYDKVEGVAPVPVGTDTNGNPIQAHLLAKRKSFIEEDRTKAENRRRETESSLVRGEVPSAGPNSKPVDGPSYVTSETSIGRGNQILEP